MKKLFILGLSAFLTLSPAAAEEEMEEGFNLMEEGARLFFRGLMGEMDQAIIELEVLVEDLTPFLEELAVVMDDINAYELPEVLPNGDIIIRRRVPLEVPPAEGEIDI